MCTTFAEYERENIRERVITGIANAQRGGKGEHFGRPVLMTTDRIRAARDLMAPGMTGVQAANVLGVARSTLYAALARDDAKREIVAHGGTPEKRGRGRPPRKKTQEGTAAAA